MALLQRRDAVGAEEGWHRLGSMCCSQGGCFQHQSQLRRISTHSLQRCLSALKITPPEAAQRSSTTKCCRNLPRSIWWPSSGTRSTIPLLVQALHPTPSILQCPDPAVTAPQCHRCFSPHPDPFHVGLLLGLGLLLWSGLVLLVVLGFFLGGGGKTGSGNNKQVNSKYISDNERGENTPTPRRKQNEHMHGERRRSNSRLHTAKQQQPRRDGAVSSCRAGSAHPKRGAMGTSHRVTPTGAPAEPRNTELHVSHIEVGKEPLGSPSSTVELAWHCPCTDHITWVVALLRGKEFCPLFIKDKSQWG